MRILRDPVFISLDIFRRILHNEGIRNKLEEKLRTVSEGEGKSGKV